MSRAKSEAPAVDSKNAVRRAPIWMPTLLDRLRDPAPHRTYESPDEFVMTRAQMRDVLQRDLTLLLNTTSIADQIAAALHARAAASTVNYGMPALTGAFLASHQWIDIEQVIRRTVTTFEPRLAPESLAITPVVNTPVTRRQNVIAFELRGTIRLTPYPLEFVMQSALNLETRAPDQFGQNVA